MLLGGGFIEDKLRGISGMFFYFFILFWNQFIPLLEDINS